MTKRLRPPARILLTGIVIAIALTGGYVAAKTGILPTCEPGECREWTQTDLLTVASF